MATAIVFASIAAAAFDVGRGVADHERVGAIRERERAAGDLGPLARADREGAAERGRSRRGRNGRASRSRRPPMLPVSSRLATSSRPSRSSSTSRTPGSTSPSRRWRYPGKLLAVNAEEALHRLLVRRVADARERRLRDRVVGQARGRHPLEARCARRSPPRARPRARRRRRAPSSGASRRCPRRERSSRASALALGERRLRGLLERAGEPHRVLLRAVDEHGRARHAARASPRGGSARSSRARAGSAGAPAPSPAARGTSRRRA